LIDFVDFGGLYFFMCCFLIEEQSHTKRGWRWFQKKLPCNGKFRQWCRNC